MLLFRVHMDEMFKYFIWCTYSKVVQVGGLLSAIVIRGTEKYLQKQQSKLFARLMSTFSVHNSRQGNLHREGIVHGSTDHRFPLPDVGLSGQIHSSSV